MPRYINPVHRAPQPVPHLQPVAHRAQDVGRETNRPPAPVPVYEYHVGDSRMPTKIRR